MIPVRYEMRCYRRPWMGGDDIALVLFDLGSTAQRSVATQVIFEVPVDGSPVEPTFSFSASECQYLMDQLWDVGIRPTAGKGSAGQMSAVQNHLKDMRKLVSNTLKVDL